MKGVFLSLVGFTFLVSTSSANAACAERPPEERAACQSCIAHFPDQNSMGFKRCLLTNTRFKAQGAAKTPGKSGASKKDEPSKVPTPPPVDASDTAGGKQVNQKRNSKNFEPIAPNRKRSQKISPIVV